MIRRLLVWLPLPVILFSFIYTLIVGQVETWVIILVVAAMLLSSFVAQSGRK
jgi:hypothetical protein